jgi:hypothetical protein
MNTLQYALMITIFFSMSQPVNHYTQSSIDALLKNLAKYHNINVKRRWIFHCLRGLIDRGYLRRKSRYRHDPLGLISQIPSLLTFTLRGMAWLATMGIAGTRKLYKKMLNWLNKGDKRWPSKHDFDDGTYLPEDPQDRERLKRLFEIVGTRI